MGLTLTQAVLLVLLMYGNYVIAFAIKKLLTQNFSNFLPNIYFWQTYSLAVLVLVVAATFFFFLRTWRVWRVPTLNTPIHTSHSASVSPSAEWRCYSDYLCFAFTPRCHNRPRVPFGPLSRAGAPFSTTVVRHLPVETLWWWPWERWLSAREWSLNSCWCDFNKSLDHMILWGGGV